MKNLNTPSALLLSAVASLSLLAGCGTAPAASEVAAEPSVQAESATTDSEAATPTPEAGNAPEQASAAAADEVAASDTADADTARFPREFRFTGGEYQANGDFTYDEQGRLTHITLSMHPDFSDGSDILIDYDESGAPHACFAPEQVEEWKGTPYEPEVYEMTVGEDGFLTNLQAGDGCALYVDFDENHLPAYFSYAQDDVGYLLTYTADADGRLTLTGADCVYGYIFGDEATPAQAYGDCDGSVIYG